MQLRTNTFDLWFYYRRDDRPKYLLLHTSQKKANKWFEGGTFWQTPPGGLMQDHENLNDAMHRMAMGLTLEIKAIWAAEFTYSIWNKKRSNLEMIPVFAAEVQEMKEVPLTWQNDKQGWFTAEECNKRLFFRGYKEGLKNIREYISEVKNPAPMLKLF